MIPNARRTAQVLDQHHAVRGVGTWDKRSMAKRSTWDGVAEAVPPIGTRSGDTLLGECGSILSSGRSASRAAADLGDGSSALRASNTQCTFSQEDVGTSLLPSSSYLPVSHESEHWSKTDPLLFAKLPQGGGGIDALTVTIYGRLTEQGKALRQQLMDTKALCTNGNAIQVAADRGIKVITREYRKRIVIEHPRDEGRELAISYASSGTGRSHTPLLVHCDGIVVRWGRIGDSEGQDGESRGPIGFLEIPGTMFLRHGERRAIEIGQRVLDSLGILVSSVRPVRVDVATDLPGQDVAEFVDAVHVGKYVSKVVQDIHYFSDVKTHKPTGFTIKSQAVLLRVYEKRVEVTRHDNDEKLKLMEQNRWGGPQQMATRVEFQFRIGKHRSRSYANLQELCGGLGDLIGWAMNVWFRLCDVDDRTHTTRAKIVDCWLRALHGFAFWAARLGTRPAPKQVNILPSDRLMRNAGGVFATAVARTGCVPEDDFTVFALLAHWFSPGEIARKCRDRAREYQALHGTNGERGSPGVMVEGHLPFREMVERLKEAGRQRRAAAEQSLTERISEHV